MGNIGTTAKILFIASIFMVSLFWLITDLNTKNTIKDNESISLMTDLQIYQTTNNFNDSLIKSNSALCSNCSFEGVDPYYRQNAEDKADITTYVDTFVKIYTFPSIVLRIFGVDNNYILLGFATLVNSLLIFLIGLQGYKALRTGEVD